MGLNNQELEAHCQTILRSRRIANKIVILCEGSIQSLKGRRSPSSYKKMQKMPDANFYNACVPENWQNNRPIFFNCGDKNDVLDTYSLLKELHTEDPSQSYLSPEKLFAFVDLDLQIAYIKKYEFINTEDIFKNLYKNFELKAEILPKHRILTTGLIYKEAYFLIPELKELFSNGLQRLPRPTYKNQLLELCDLYEDIIENLEEDKNLKQNFVIAATRLDFCEQIDCTSIKTLKQSLKNCSDIEIRAYSLFLVSKVKNYWNNLIPEEEFTHDIENWRDQLILNIGRFYSTSTNPKHHITMLLRLIYNYYYGEE